jgi:site-specific recombinase XerD
MKSGPSGPDRAKVGHGPLSASISLQDKDRTEWAASQTERHPPGGYSEVAHFSGDPAEAWVERWWHSLLREGYDPKTVRQSRSCLRKLLAYLQESSLVVQEVGYPQAQGYLEWLGRQTPPFADWTLSGLLATASSFYRYLKAQGVVSEDPFGEIEKPRQHQSFPRTILKEPQMQRLLEELSHFDEASTILELRRRYRVHLIAELQYSTGMRIDEVAHLKPEDLDLEAGTVEVRRGKGGHRRTAFLNEYARGVLAVYLTDMRSLVLQPKNDPTLLFGANSDSLSRNVAQELERASALLGLGRLRSHDFRHAFAFHLLRSGADVRSIQDLLGHRLLRSTEVYTRVDREDLKSVLDTYHPRKWGTPQWRG